MGNAPRWPRAVRLIVQAAAVIAGIGALWLVLTATGIVDIPACRGAEGGTCGFVVSALVLAAVLIFVVAAVGIWIAVAVGRGLSSVLQLRRYGRWLSVRERPGDAPDVHDLAIEVEYHDGTGGPVAGVEIACVVVGTDGSTHRLGNAVAVTDARGMAKIDVYVPTTPSMVTVHASVPSNPGVKGAGGVFLVGGP